MNRRLISIFIVIAMLLVFAVGCGNNQNNSEAGKTKSITWGSASMGGSAQMVITAIGTVVSEHDPTLNITVQSTGGSAENPRLLRAGNVDIGHTTEAYNAMAGEGIFSDDGPIDDLMVVMKTYGVEAMVVVKDNSDIKDMGDLVGKKICIGPPGSGISQMALAILEAYNIKDFKQIDLGYNESADGIKDGSIDVLFAFTTGGIAAPYLQQLDSTDKIRTINLDMDILKKAFDKYPDFAESSIPKAAISVLEEEYKTLSSFGVQVTRTSLDENTVYSIVKNTYENKDELKNYHQLAEAIDIKTAMHGIPKQVPIHPGAAKYFKEQGVWDDSYVVGELGK